MVHASQPLSCELKNSIKLAPKIHPRAERFLSDNNLVHTLLDAFGSPLNIMFPENIDENIKSFQDVYKKHSLRGRIYVTSKPCKSKSVLRRASLLDVGVDVSSPGSLKHALSCGFSTDRIEATGPKNIEYILNCLQLDILLNIDSFSELKIAEQLYSKIGLSRKIRILIRMGGFSASGVTYTPQDGTFGTHADKIPALLDWVNERKDIFDFQGFSFHSSSMTESLRLESIQNLLELTFLSIEKGLKPKTINLGGGFQIQYANSRDEWDAYLETLKRSILDNKSCLTWNLKGLGFREQNGRVAGAQDFINHYPESTKGDEFDRWISGRLPQFGNIKAIDVIKDSLLGISVEAGRGAWDQCGLTLARVVFQKESNWNEILIGLEMNQSHIQSASFKKLTHPILVTRDLRKRNLFNSGVYYMGNLCYSHDILQYNKTYPEYLPETGDAVAFINTAPYAMDFIESETLMQPLAKKISVFNDEDNALCWSLDETYLPVNIV